MCLSFSPIVSTLWGPTTAFCNTSRIVWVPGNGGVATESDGGQRGAEEAAADGPRASAAKVSQVGLFIAPEEKKECTAYVLETARRIQMHNNFKMLDNNITHPVR